MIRRRKSGPRRAGSTVRRGRKTGGKAKRLEAYRARRDFAITPEPAPEAAPRGNRGRPTFMVHKHDATRLHYDLRLEIHGALASWAIPKGPSYDPKDRRLAVQTEDHPLAYGEFEGRIPEGEYGAGDSLIWDRGTWDTVPPGQARAMRKKGHLVFELDGEKLHGRWHLVRTRAFQGGKESWLFFKGRDEHADPSIDVVASRPESVVSGRRITRGPTRAAVRKGVHPKPLDLLLKVWPPMKATLVDTDETLEAPPPANEWALEVKYDGFRALAAISGGEVSLQSRNGLDLSGRFPSIHRALGRLEASEVVLDGEVVAVDAEGIARFQRLQNASEDLRYYVFDLLWLDGRDLRGRTLDERRDLLESVLSNVDPPIVLAERLPMTLGAALARARNRRSEGVIAKRRASVYEGRRSREWLKVKVLQTEELTIVGFTPISTGQDAIGALLLAVKEKDGFRYAGKTGTGYTDAVRRSLFRMLSKEKIASPAARGAPRMRDATWVEPKHVAQVSFSEWTEDGKIRHPSFQGLREDKQPSETSREKPVKPRFRTRWKSADWVLPEHVEP